MRTDGIGLRSTADLVRHCRDRIDAARLQVERVVTDLDPNG